MAHWLPADGLMQPNRKRPAMQWKSDIMSKSAYGQMNLLVWVQGKRKTCSHPQNEEVCEQPLEASWQRVVWASFVEMMMRPAAPNGGTECSSTVSIIGHFCNSFDPDGHMGRRRHEKKPVCYFGLSTISGRERKLIFT